jgi:uncharacterized protein YdaU (DUF1376 family)
MAKGDFYFPLYYHRLLTATIGWKDEEFGAYVRLLIAQFDQGVLPGDLEELKRIAPSAKKNWKLLSKKFQDDGKGGLINSPMNDIRESINKQKEKNFENGKKGGRPKPKDNRTVSQKEPDGSISLTQTKPITIDNIQYTNEREPPPILYSIEHCLELAINDDRWFRKNKTNRKELQEFNDLLERRGHYQKNPADYKSHFANWKDAGKKEGDVKQAYTQPSTPLKTL